MLPSELLGLILSHFTFKEQMAFSILSRRWRYLWTLTTSLDFDGANSLRTSMEDNKLSYVSWVNRVLASCQSPALKDFRVRFSMSENDEGYINEWLRYALAKKVKTLVLNFTDFTDHLSPRNLDECYVFPYRSLHRDVEIHFKQLEKLLLDHVRVDVEAPKFLLHNCPLLEDLSISNSSNLSNVSIIGPFPSLKRLVVSFCPGLDLIEIRDVNLVYLVYDGPHIQLRLHNVPKLINLAVLATMLEQMNDDLQFTSILQQLEALYLGAIFKFRFPVKMTNLKQLEIIYMLLGSGESYRWLGRVIRSLPSLQKFVFKASLQNPRFRERELVRKKIKGSYPELKEVELVGFLGAASDLEFVWHFVDNAAGLKRVLIDPREVMVNGDTYWKGSYLKKERIALDRAEKQLALQMPNNIKLEFLHPPPNKY
ncbi:hypothetical protein OROMI_007047 [Orobanche minor]